MKTLPHSDTLQVCCRNKTYIEGCTHEHIAEAKQISWLWQPKNHLSTFHEKFQYQLHMCWQIASAICQSTPPETGSHLITRLRKRDMNVRKFAFVSPMTLPTPGRVERQSGTRDNKSFNNMITHNVPFSEHANKITYLEPLLTWFFLACIVFPNTWTWAPAHVLVICKES